MGLDHKTFEAKVKGSLGDFLYIFGTAAHMARIHEERQLGITATEFDGDVPVRVVAIPYLVEGRETSVDYTQLADSGTAEAFQGTDPEFKVRIDRILYQHRYL